MHLQDTGLARILNFMMDKQWEYKEYKKRAGQRQDSVCMRRTGVQYITARGWGLTSPYSANRKQARRIINNSDCYLPQSSLHNMLLSIYTTKDPPS